jgi:hypothetical protein
MPVPNQPSSPPKVAAAAQLGDDGVGLLLAGDEDVRGVVLQFRLEAGVLRRICRLQSLVGHRPVHQPPYHQPGRHRSGLVLDFQCFGRRRAAQLARQHRLLDHLVEKPGEQHVVGQRLILVGQVGAHRDHVAGGNLAAVHFGQHGIGGNRRRSGLLRGGRHGQAQGKRRGASETIH